MQQCRRTPVHIFPFRILMLCFLLVLLPAGLRADEVKTTVRKVPYPAAPERERPKNVTLEAAFQRWSVKVTWDMSRGAESGFEARFVTADVIAGLANQLMKDGKLTDVQAQTLYDERRKKYYGDMDRGAFGDKIAFLGHIELNGDTYTAGQLNAPWQFELRADEGVPLASAQVEMGEVKLQKSVKTGLNSWYRAFTVTFNNQDPKTKQRVMTVGVHSMTLVVKGMVGEGRAIYGFDPAAH